MGALGSGKGGTFVACSFATSYFSDSGVRPGESGAPKLLSLHFLSSRGLAANNLG